MSRRAHRRGPVRITANLTPLIDMTFLLIVFFILVTRFSDTQRVGMALPRPASPASTPAEERRRVTINVVPRPDRPELVGMLVAAGREHTPDAAGRGQLSEQVTELFSGAPELRLNVRADRRIEYRYMEPVLRAIADGAARAGASPRINLVVVREQER